MKNKHLINIIVYEAIIASLTIVLLMIGMSITASWKYISFIVVIIFTIASINNENIRLINIGFAVIFISLSLTDVLNVVIFLIPNVILACICALIYNSKYKFLIPILITANLFIEWTLHAYIVFNKNVSEIIVDVLLGINSNSKLSILLLDKQIFWIFFLLFICLIGIFESILYFITCNIIIKKIQVKEKKGG